MDVDLLLLADGAQVAGDKLYVLGGGWTIVWAADFPVTHKTSVAVGTMVDWQETNQRHSLEVVLLSADGKQVGDPLVSGEFEVGRPPGMPAGTAQRFMVAAAVVMSLESPGSHEVVVRIDGTDCKRATFSAVRAAERAHA